VEPSFASGSGSSRVTIDVRAGACP
jgi:hypothetical protein